MSSVSIYLNFERETEEAFLFYRKVFGTEFNGPIMRMGDVPVQEGQPELAEEDKQLVMHVSLPLLGGVELMGTDAQVSMGFSLVAGNNVHINLNPDTREEADRLFNELSEGGKVETPMQDMFWGDYYGAFSDKYGVRWMINYENKEADKI